MWFQAAACIASVLLRPTLADPALQTLLAPVQDIFGVRDTCLSGFQLEELADAANLTAHERSALPLVCLPLDGNLALAPPSQLRGKVPESIQCSRVSRCANVLQLHVLSARARQHLLHGVYRTCSSLSLGTVRCEGYQASNVLRRPVSNIIC
jgi:hypothetical protein